jgi:hypothetical protein
MQKKIERKVGQGWLMGCLGWSAQLVRFNFVFLISFLAFVLDIQMDSNKI